MLSADAKTISGLLGNIIIADVLDENQFKEIVKYTNTLFSFGFNNTKVFNILNKVLHPGVVSGQPYDIKEIINNKVDLIDTVDNKIKHLNKWVKDLNSQPNQSGPISIKELEKYIWTLDIHQEDYDVDSSAPKESDSIVSTVVSNGDTYIVDHNANGATNKIYLKISWQSNNKEHQIRKSWLIYCNRFSR